ncbi:glycosyltransferase [Spartinivicinus ruber]|uniref:glycosyltransferase n=1 Tax=Spartinivicinus ruber TaxID=2683272 RepID=UPI0013D5B84C|nr:glycosyltransferase [Spartinivicinus ruber]
MNIFIIPSWYPSSSSQITGIFTKEQALAIAEIQSNANVIISRWGQSEGEISVKEIWKIFNTLSWYFKAQHGQWSKTGKIWEVLNPCITWSKQLPLNCINSIIEANRKNLLSATNKFGKIDIIHAHVSYPAGFVAAKLKEEFGIPYVLTEHMSPFPFSPYLTPDGKLIDELQESFDKADKVVAVSPSLKKKINKFNINNVVYVPNVIDERRFNISSSNNKKFIFFTLCKLTEQKGIDTLLTAISLLRLKNSNIYFRIGGDGPLRKKLIHMTKTLGIEDQVEWLGEVTRSQASQQFGECHAYVMPSRHETFGIVFAESIASGKPVIATRCGGPECIVNSENGILVDIDDPEQLSDAMYELYNNYQNYSPIKIRQDFEQRFSRRAVVSQLHSIYLDLLKRSV